MISIISTVVASVFLVICFLRFNSLNKEVHLQIGLLPKHLKNYIRLYYVALVSFFIINLYGIHNLSINHAFAESPIAMIISFALIFIALFTALNIIVLRLMLRYIMSIKLNQRDELTNLMRKIPGSYKIQKALDISDTPVCVAMLDIDNFKKSNDTYGHLEGDKLLKKIAQALNTTVGNDNLAIRFGGDEFLVCIVNKCENDTLHIFEQIIEKGEKIGKKYDGISLGISIGYSCGIGKSRGGSSTCTSLIEEADRALYYVKNHKKGTIHKYCEDDFS
ncbi:MAG: GGDEF domain-containing protein [Sphaerochaeta sp.]